MTASSRFRLAAGMLTLLLAAAARPTRAEDQQPQQEQTCTLEAGPTRSVVRVIDAETVLLDDNEEVRLIGALAPRSPDLKPDATPWPRKRQPPRRDAISSWVTAWSSPRPGALKTATGISLRIFSSRRTASGCGCRAGS